MSPVIQAPKVFGWYVVWGPNTYKNKVFGSLKCMEYSHLGWSLWLLHTLEVQGY